MSKAKLSFSFLLSLVLVGMLSIVAFAAAPTAPTELKFTSPTKDSVTLTWKQVDDATGYKIYWDGSTTGEDATGTTYTKTGLEKAITYNVEVTAVNADGESPKTAMKVVLHNGTVPTKDLTKPDNDLPNAHKTGEGTLIKNPDRQMKNDKTTNGAHKLHGSYQNNTNSCASCHQTHTAASSKSLLFKNGAYNTCTACHDGTLGFYNVFGTSNAEDMGAGTFGGTHDGNMSVHMSTGALEISAAPGSNSKATGATWTGEFTCASCHDPHGSFSSRLLKNSPNGMSSVERTAVVDGAGKPSTVYGNKLMNVPVQKTPPTGTINAQSLNDYFFKDITITEADIAPGAYYENTGLKKDDRVLQLQRYLGGAWKNAPGVYLSKTGVDNTSSWPKMYDGATPVTVSKDQATAGDYWFNNSKAYFKVPEGKTITKISDIQKAYTVDLFEVTTDKLGQAIPSVGGVQPTRTLNGYLTTGGKGVQFNEWCGSCHVDYFTQTKVDTGIDKNYNHHTMSDSYNCARCHYAHGTDAKIMSDALGRTYETLQNPGGFTADQAKEYLKDVNASSALKRYTNMAVCYGCHTSSKSSGLINNNDFNNIHSPNGFITDSNEFKGNKLIPTP
ncbi:cytochrome c3 family protein [Neobacillus sp. SCS-31]|uniref:cytochrome c3 family protein n=1 Tax=Neobacillus oceani TaxID=3115292 RepID=UPI0039068C65